MTHETKNTSMRFKCPVRHSIYLKSRDTKLVIGTKGEITFGTLLYGMGFGRLNISYTGAEK